MLPIIWMSLICIALGFGWVNGCLSEVISAIPNYAWLSVKMVVMLSLVMMLWLSMAEMAERLGFLAYLRMRMQPLLQRLFPEIPADHPAMSAITANIIANMLGLANAATPFGVKAMHELEQLNQKPGTATDAMCMFLAINTSSVQLVPTTAIAFLAANGAIHPTIILVPTLFATTCSTLVAITFAKCLARLYISRKVLA